MKTAPQYFAGRLYLEDEVDGGTGNTPDEAVSDYFANHADDEINWADTEDDEGTFTLEIFHVHPTQEGDDQARDWDWDWELGRRAETRTFHWHREPDPNFPELDQILYTPKTQQ